MTQASRASFSRRTKRDYLVAERVNQLTEHDLVMRGAWTPLADLSQATALEFIDTNLDSIIFTGNRFDLIADVHVTLNYPEDTFFSDSYGATVSGRIEQERVEIERIEVDVSSFYE